MFADSAYVVLQVVVPSNVDDDMAAQFLVSTQLQIQTMHAYKMTHDLHPHRAMGYVAQFSTAVGLGLKAPYLKDAICPLQSSLGCDAIKVHMEHSILLCRSIL